MSDAVSRKSRRNFLLAATAGGAAGAAALAARRTPAPAASAATGDKRSGAGYAESAHVRNYYRTTKV